MSPITRETIVERRQQTMRWSAIFAGAVLSVGLWLLLQALGMGLGLAAVDAEDAGTLRGAGIGSGIWSLIAPLIAMFLGAIVTGRMCGSCSRKIGMLHGTVTWALATIVGMWAVMALVMALVSGVSQVGGAAVTGTATVVSTAATQAAKVDTGDVLATFGIDANDLLAPVNRRLEAAGKPPVNAQQLSATVRAVAQRGVREGKLDREVLVSELARQTALSRADAEELANDFMARYGDFAARVQNSAAQIKEDVKEVALSAVDKTGKVLLFGGIMMIISLGGAIAGAAAGVQRARSRGDGDRVIGTTTTGTTTTGTVTPQGYTT